MLAEYAAGYCPTPAGYDVQYRCWEYVGGIGALPGHWPTVE